MLFVYYDFLVCDIEWYFGWAIVNCEPASHLFLCKYYIHNIDLLSSDLFLALLTTLLLSYIL